MHIKKSQKRDFQNVASVRRTEQNNVDNSTIFFDFAKNVQLPHRPE